MSGTACDEVAAVKRPSYFKKSNIIIPFLAQTTEVRTLPVHYCTPNLRLLEILFGLLPMMAIIVPIVIHRQQLLVMSFKFGMSTN